MANFSARKILKYNRMVTAALNEVYSDGKCRRDLDRIIIPACQDGFDEEHAVVEVREADDLLKYGANPLEGKKGTAAFKQLLFLAEIIAKPDLFQNIIDTLQESNARQFNHIVALYGKRIEGRLQVTLSKAAHDDNDHAAFEFYRSDSINKKAVQLHVWLCLAEDLFNSLLTGDIRELTRNCGDQKPVDVFAQYLSRFIINGKLGFIDYDKRFPTLSVSERDKTLGIVVKTYHQLLAGPLYK